ncbi:MAG: glycine--tRNA ligase subunit beta [Deltaproteobacteria bacterium]|nr:glycine--tRNA ligase subunit beta [Deltaproteobacteria bacterium]
MDLLIEIGCEELPASSLKPALAHLANGLAKELEDARLFPAGLLETEWARRELEHNKAEGLALKAPIAAPTAAELAGTFISTYATPRRLALTAFGLPERAPDAKKTLQGPPAKAAFGPDGKPTKAAEGFAKKAGVAVEALRVEGDRVVVVQDLVGQRTADVLPGILEKLVATVPFKKAMRWGWVPESFARPVHWIGASLDGKQVPVKYGDVTSSLTTRGHRFHANAEAPLPAAGKYADTLRSLHVLADWDERKAKVWAEAQRAAAELGGEVLPDEELLETVTGLVEEPHAVLGHFEQSFLDLPPEVLVSEMRGHQKYFAVRDPATQKLLPAFVATSNSKVVDPSSSRRGYERVLRARMTDARFFFVEDKKTPLAARVEKLGRVTFFAGLGSQLDRVDRIKNLAQWLHGATGRADVSQLVLAAQLCKADLTCGMVGEFPELQGTMGRVYALHEGQPAMVAEALAEHYLPKGASEEMPRTDEGTLLGLADRLDQLVGFFGLGKEPTGTADPFALRRAAIGLLRLVTQKQLRFDLVAALTEAQRLHGTQRAPAGTNKVSQEPALLAKLWTFLAGRLEVLWKDRAAPDAVEAVLATGSRDLVLLEKKLAALTNERQKNPERFAQTAAAFKRIANILSQAQEKKLAAVAFSVDKAQAPAEKALAQALDAARAKVEQALGEREDHPSAYAALSELKPSVDTFFDDVMVMDPDTSIRDNRLALLRGLHELFSPLAEFGRLQA